MGVLVALLALPACSSKRTPTSAANLSVRTPAGVAVSRVVVKVSGPALPASKTFPLSDQGSAGTWGGVLDSLPVGRDYLFEASAQSKLSGATSYLGSASGIVVSQGRVTTVVITAHLTAHQAEAVVPADNAAPIVDSLVLSSTSVVPGGTITAQATAHDPNPGDILTFAWSSSPVPGGFQAASSATTDWTAPSTEGDQTLVFTVTDNQGASASASIVVHVSASTDFGEAEVEVTFNNWPVVTNLSADPGSIALGSPIALAVTASDADGDALSYAWTSTCTSGSFASPTAAATIFTLPAGATNTTCDVVVAVSDGRGGSTTGQTTLPVGKPVTIEAPTITIGAQSSPAVDHGGSVSFSVEASDPQGSALTFQWTSADGTLSNQVDGADTSHVVWTAPAVGDAFTVSVLVTDGLGASKKYDFPVSTLAPAPVAVPIPRFATWLLAAVLAMVGLLAARRQRWNRPGR